MPRGYRAALMATCAVTAAKAAQCFAAKNGARPMEAKPRAPSKSKQQRRAARLCMDLYMHIRTPPICSLVLPPRGAALPSLLAPFFESLCSRLPCKRTNNKKRSAFKSARSFPLPCSYSPPFCKRTSNTQSSAFQSAGSFPLSCSYSLRAVAPAEDDRLTPLLHLRSQWCPFSLCCSW
jgi:hypothetical protein